MKFSDVLEKFDFLFKEEGIVNDIDLVTSNIEVMNKKEEYSKICLEYLENEIGEMAPVTLLTNLGLISIGESLNIMKYSHHINQFENDFMEALVLKYGKMKMQYKKSSTPQNILLLLKAIMIYQFCVEHELHRNSLEAYVINSRYRINRLEGFDNEKLSIIKEFCKEYDKTTMAESIKLENVIIFLEQIEKVIEERLEKISGRIIYLEEQYNFFVFTEIDIKNICAENLLDYYKVIKVIDNFVCYIGEFRNIDVKEMYLDNPVYKKFIIKLGEDIFFVPNINVVAENLFSILEEIVKLDNQNLEKYSECKSKYLENKTTYLLRNKFGNSGQIYLNSEWDYQTEHGENDCTLIYENYALIFEDKSGKINKNTYKGIIKSAINDSEKNIEYPTKQAENFSRLLEENYGNTLVLKIKGGGENVFDLTRVNKNIGIGVVFDETALQNLNLKGKRHIPIISIFQLNKILNCLDEPEIIDYFLKRTLIEKNTNYRATEYDLLYTYLINGINTTEKIYKKSEELILFPYKEGTILRHDLNREIWFQKVIDKVRYSNGEFWLDKVISLLEMPPRVQEQIWREIITEKKLQLIDNIEERNKVIVAELLEYYDYDTEDEITDNLNEYSMCENVLYIAFTENLKHIIVKIMKKGKIY